MNPTLVAVAGPLRGHSRAVTDAATSIGRDLTNAISISDASISRRHSVVQKAPKGWTIRDLDSLNGTFVNGLPVKERALCHGDQIQIGSSLFYFLDDTELSPGIPALRQEGEEGLGSTAGLETNQPQSRGSRNGTSSDFEVVLRATELIRSAESEESLARELFALAFEVCPADRAAFFTSAGAENCSPILIVRRSREDTSSVPICGEVVLRAFRQGEAIRSDHVDSSEGRTASPVGALAAVPLGQPDPVGVLYLDTFDPSVRFDEAKVRTLVALGNIAAAALEKLRREHWTEGLSLERTRNGAVSDLVGESEAMQRVDQFLAQVAPTDATVLILGESGTGKELAARAIHRNSPRTRGPFIAVNCAALTESLLESELFGHERGAFTGAFAQKKGKLELADGGTVFLDEVAELTPALQAKLLRVLQEREFERVGGSRPIRVDVRFVAATNRNLEQAISAGKFRDDLYYRLNVVALTMPALRERPEDIPLLASYFASRFARKLNRSTPGFSPPARECLLRYSWPGNVRELSNAVERAVVLGGDVIGTEDLPEAVLEAGQSADVAVDTYHAAVLETKKRMIREALEQSGGSYTDAAKRLGVHPNYLHRLIRNLNLKEELRK